MIVFIVLLDVMLVFICSKVSCCRYSFHSNSKVHVLVFISGKVYSKFCLCVLI